MFVRELFLGQTTGCLFLKMGAVKEGADGKLVVNTDWPLAEGVQRMVLDDTLANGAVLVSEAFVKENMCDGNTQFVPERQLDAETALPLTATQEPIQFSKHGIQELTSNSWKFSQLQPEKFKDAPAGTKMTTTYRVLFDGVRAVLAKNDSARTDAEQGEALLEQKANVEGKDLKEFITTSALVYAVAVPA